MAQLTRDQRVFIVLNYTQTQSSTAVQNAFQARFRCRNPPAPSTILRNVQRYLNAGTSLNLNKGNSGRRRSIRTAENIEVVRDLLQQNPHVSARRNPLPISRTSFNRITRLEIKWHPYRIDKVFHMVQAMFITLYNVLLNSRHVLCGRHLGREPHSRPVSRMLWHPPLCIYKIIVLMRA